MSTRDALALALAGGVGPVRFRELVAGHGGAAAALAVAVPPDERHRARALADEVMREVERAGASVLMADDPAHGYPAALLDLDDPPPFLIVRGDVSALATPAAAIVGTRRATAYGERVTRELATALARAGVAVVSGLALGVDAAAHRAALAAAGRTVGVLGTGVDVAYPAAHEGLQRTIAAEGGVLLSEHPCGARAHAGAFPRRNRVIAALASVTIVVEAPVKSGALITARHALDLGRTVAAVPGPIDSPQSAGTNELLRDGAQVIATVDDALALVGRSAARPASARAHEMSADELAVWSALGDGAADMDTLALRSALPARRCLAAVSSLELIGALDCALTGEIRRR